MVGAIFVSDQSLRWVDLDVWRDLLVCDISWSGKDFFWSISCSCHEELANSSTLIELGRRPSNIAETAFSLYLETLANEATSPLGLTIWADSGFELLFNIFDSFLTTFKLPETEPTMFIWIILLLNAFSYNALVFRIHVEAWSVRIVVRPFVAFSEYVFTLTGLITEVFAAGLAFIVMLRRAHVWILNVWHATFLQAVIIWRFK